MVLSALLGLAGWLLWGRSAAIVMAGAHALHWLVDQAGYLGSNMMFPFTSRRSPGRKWTHSGEASVNAGIVWFCSLLVFWNLYSSSGFPASPFGFVKLMAWGFLLPAGMYALLRRVMRQHDRTLRNT